MRAIGKDRKINRRQEMFEQQWKERLAAVQKEVDNEIASLEQ